MTTDNTSTCSYQFESLSRTTPSTLVDVPQDSPNECPHTVTEEDDSRCLFHANQHEYPPRVLADEFMSRVRSSTKASNFAGSSFAKLDLSGEILETPDGEPIDLRGAIIDGTIDLSSAEVRVPLLLGSATIVGSLEADNAHFFAPVDLSGANIRSGIHLHDATFEAGVAANDIQARAADARAVTIRGPAVFDNAEFSANVRFGRSQFENRLSFKNAHLGRLLNFTAAEVQGTASFSSTSVKGETRFTATSFDQRCSFTGCELDDKVDFSHSIIRGDFCLDKCNCAGEVLFEDFRCQGTHTSFDNATFQSKVEMNYADFSTEIVSIVDAAFESSVWFVCATFGESVDLSNTRFEDSAHLREAEFGGDLIISECDFNGQSFIFGSTIGGNCNAANASFIHFQFGATVAEDIDFSGCRFDESAYFSKSEVGGNAVFDNASFAGNPDFSESSFKRETSFENTEFLVDPTFEGTRFANEPNFEAASYPDPSRRNLSDRRRRNLVVARPEKLQNSGLTISTEALAGNIDLPLHSKSVVKPDKELTRAVEQAMKDVEQSTLYSLFKDSIVLARTAVAELENESEGTLVFGISINHKGSDAESFLEEAKLIGAYELKKDESELCFGHLNSDIGSVDLLVCIEADDDAFESGSAVGSSSEFRSAITRQQMIQSRLMHLFGHTAANKKCFPALVAAAHVD